MGLKYSNLKNRKPDAKPSPKFREAALDMKDEPTSEPLTHNIPLNPFKKPVENFDQGLLQRGRSQSPQNETVNVYSVKIPVDLASGEVNTRNILIPSNRFLNLTLILADFRSGNSRARSSASHGSSRFCRRRDD